MRRVQRMRLGAGVLVAVIAAAGMAAFATAGPVHERAAQKPVLGLKGLMGQYGKGWGKVKPKVIFNGGVPNGRVHSIKWKRWGTERVIGRGLGSQYRPGGGYYPDPVTVKLRPRKIGQCPGQNRPAYTALRAKMQKKPGGSFGRWFNWSGLSSICERVYEAGG